MSSVRSVYRNSLSEAEAFGLSQRSLPARAHAWAMAVLRWWGFSEPGRPDIISGFRSPQEQAELLRRWKRGDREGLDAKPACRSWHTVGRAIDVEDDVSGFDTYARLLTQYTGAVDGRNFDDPGHFHWTQTRRPTNICSRFS